MISYSDIELLTENLTKLSAKDAEFGQSLIQGYRRYGRLSEKQGYWVAQLNLRAAQPKPATETVAVGELGAVYRMFEKAKSHLKHPAIVLGYAGGELKISVAGPQSRTPGALQVKDVATGTWFGRVHQNGAFEKSRRDTPPASVEAVLSRFAADPIKAASEHGHLTGKCCFCNRALTDARSTTVGYGPVCAEHFGLAWGHVEPLAA